MLFFGADKVQKSNSTEQIRLPYAAPAAHAEQLSIID